MKIESTTVGSYLVVKVLETRLGADLAVDFKREVGRFVDEGQKSIVLDLALVEFIDSTGLGAILSLLKRVGKDGEIAIAGANYSVTSMFKLTRMDRVFAMHATVEAATGVPALNSR